MTRSSIMHVQVQSRSMRVQEIQQKRQETIELLIDELENPQQFNMKVPKIKSFNMRPIM